jgi:quinol monooxygenase YgiN
MVYVMARIVARPDAVDALKQVLIALVEPSRREPGCISYALYERADAPNEFQTVEQWARQADADAHMATAHVQAAVAAAKPLLAQPPAIHAYALIR